MVAEDGLPSEVLNCATSSRPDASATDEATTAGLRAKTNEPSANGGWIGLLGLVYLGFLRLFTLMKGLGYEVYEGDCCADGEACMPGLQTAMFSISSVT